MLRGQDVPDAVYPKDVLATVVTTGPKDDAKTTTVPLRCCVWGSVLEVNPNLSPQLLQKDPLLDGYLAVILPSGRFPPAPPNEEEEKQEETEVSEQPASKVAKTNDAKVPKEVETAEGAIQEDA